MHEADSHSRGRQMVEQVPERVPEGTEHQELVVVELLFLIDVGKQPVQLRVLGQVGGQPSNLPDLLSEPFQV